jgi:hypothetical protein
MQRTDRLRYLIFCIVAAWAIVQEASPATAQPLYVCDTYTVASNPIRPPADIFLTGSPESAFSICRMIDGQTFYVEGTAPQKLPTGICRYVVRELFQASGGWTENPPPGVSRHLQTQEKKALPDSSSCPPRGIDYVELMGVPDDIFRHLMSYWREIAASPQKFDAAIPREWANRQDFLRLRASTLVHDQQLELTSITKISNREYRLWFYRLPENLILTLAESGNSFRFVRFESSVS